MGVKDRGSSFSVAAAALRQACALKCVVGLLFGGSGLQRCAGACPSPYPTVRQSLSARVVPHPATWPLRKAVVLSKEGAQLF